MKSDADFVRDFKRSLSAVLKVAAWLKVQDYDVLIVPPLLRTTSAERMEFADSGDLMVFVNGVRQRIEVKQRGLDFQSADDYPYPSVFVDEEYKLVPERSPYPLLAYVIVNKSQTAVGVIPAETRKHWEVEHKELDRKQNRSATFVSCPKHLVKWYNLPS